MIAPSKGSPPMPLLLRSLFAIFLAALVLSPVPGRGADLDPGDLAFWQAIANSKDPAEYRAYLEAYPQGRFAALARIRAGEGTAPRALAAPPSGQGAAEIAFWQAVENSTNPTELAAYLSAYPAGRFAALARLRMAALGAPPGAATNGRAPSVTLESESARASSLRFVEDIAAIVNTGGERTMLPVIGGGSSQNLADLRLNPSIDMAIVQSDGLDVAKAHNRDRVITYIAKLYNEELHLLARPNIKTIADLAREKVDVDVRGGGTEVTTARLFRLLKIPVVTVNDPAALALDKLKKGEIAALALVTAKPSGFFKGLSRKDGLHFLSVPLNPALTRAFIPSRLGASDYPGLVPPDRPVDTVAVGTVLAVASLDPGSLRYRAVGEFVDRFFGKFDSLLDPNHDRRWREVNLAAELPGWRRFAAASRWLGRNVRISTLSPQALEAIFSRFIDEREQASGGPPMPAQEKAELFKEFENWQHGRLH
jgi:uncharacterized protein